MCPLVKALAEEIAASRWQNARSVREGSLTPHDVMTADEVAEMLRLPISTVYELARRGELPGRRFGRAWRFLRPSIEEMLRETGRSDSLSATS